MLGLPCGSAAALLSVLLLQGCAAPGEPEGTTPRPQADSAPGPPPQAFRLEVTHVLGTGGGQFTLGLRLVPVGDPPADPGILYAEKFTFPEAPLRPAAHGLPPQIAERMKTVLGTCPGFSLSNQVEVFEVAKGSTVLPDIVVLAPVDRILAFEELFKELQESSNEILRVGPIDIHFCCFPSRVNMSWHRILPGSPEDDLRPWLAAGSRNPRDLITIEDAAGDPLMQQGGGITSGTIDLEWVSGVNVPIQYPVTVKARVPSRWERSVQRFVISGVPVPDR